jgi:hypothetical protein
MINTHVLFLIVLYNCERLHMYLISIVLSHLFHPGDTSCIGGSPICKTFMKPDSIFFWWCFELLMDMVGYCSIESDVEGGERRGPCSL